MVSSCVVLCMLCVHALICWDGENMAICTVKGFRCVL